MRRNPLQLYVFLFLSLGTMVGTLALVGQAQDPHVNSRYMPDAKMTVVETDMLFVSNTSDQFMQLGFVARYPKQQLVIPPKNITLTIFSNSPKLLYENSKNQKLVVLTDGENWSAGELTYWSGKGSKASKGQEMFASERRPGLGLQNPLPPNAKVSEGRAIDQLYMEWLLIELKPQQFAKIAKAQKLEFQIGQTRVPFTESQMNTIRAFASKITP